MLPEGLQYASASDTMAKIKSLGMNVIRLTFAIEMIDQIYQNGAQDITIQEALTEALGTENGTIILKEMLSKNPSFTNQTTRLEANKWPNFVSIGMRNELRDPEDNSATVEPYDWPHWYNNMVSAAYAIHETNPDPLIFFSGLDFDTDLGPIALGSSLSNTSNLTFNASSFPFSDKLVFELHNYDTDATSCQEIYDDLYPNGYNALDLSNTTVKNHVPVVMTEFGFAQDNSTYLEPYASCLRKLLPKWKSGWTTWVLSGSYYIREGTQDYDETWALPAFPKTSPNWLHMGIEQDS
ncbi:putative cellulase family protein [Phaeomoniella chlamydospora]|uniref:Putative cellulase family protein n=1 Tax=Phaeomoniella chlamydospora TaxID=158046 RepID=A0A0G2GXQ7_PHACM|nr:putative cellulase family protein [Phaeomoniella chlamydospora]